MTEIRLHGRGGQGAVVASEILASALFREGKQVQTFPEFGVERRGAPVAAYLRIDDRPINLRCKVYTPDHIIVLDQVLLDSVDVTTGLRRNGWVVLNSAEPPAAFGRAFKGFRVATVDASGIAIRYKLGPRTAPIVNTAILGAFARVTGMVKLASVIEGIREYVPVKLEDNIKATRDAHETVRVGTRVP